MKDKLLTLDEKKSLYLEMLEEIDAFCRTNKIKYSLSSGTLIGALRHKGFIPWDDDLDITMPLPDMIRFKNEFKSANMRFCDVNTCAGYEFPFPRIVSTKTYSKVGGFNCGPGVAIDIYIVIGLPDDEVTRHKYLKEAQRLYQKRCKHLKINRIVTSRIPIKILPCYKKDVVQYCNYLMNPYTEYGSSNSYFRVASAMTDELIAKNTLDFDFFEGLVDVDFEGRKFLSTIHADKYLTQRYGDYMTPPPVEKRIQYHKGHFYWR